jgi:nucleolar GTP-binding protein
LQTLRAMPVVDLETPTLCLVGAPNVGKSSLVRVLSTGKPEVWTSLLASSYFVLCGSGCI